MKGTKKLNPAPFEGHVSQILTDAKAKLAALNSDIESLHKQNSELEDQLKGGNEEKRDIFQTNTKLREQLRQVRSNNEHLIQQKNQLSAAVTTSKAQLAMLIETNEKQKAEIQSEIQALQQNEAKLKQMRIKEESEFQESQKIDLRKIELLRQNIAEKEHEIRMLKGMLTELVDREAQREGVLDQENKVFQSISYQTKKY